MEDPGSSLCSKNVFSFSNNCKQNPYTYLVILKSTVSLQHVRQGTRFGQCTESSECSKGPWLPEGALLGTVPIGGGEFKQDIVMHSVTQARMTAVIRKCSLRVLD